MKSEINGILPENKIVPADALFLCVSSHHSVSSVCVNYLFTRLGEMLSERGEKQKTIYA